MPPDCGGLLGPLVRTLSVSLRDRRGRPFQALYGPTVMSTEPVSTVAPSVVEIFFTTPSDIALSSFCILSVSLRDTRGRPLIRFGRHKDHESSTRLHGGALLYRDLGYFPR